MVEGLVVTILSCLVIVWVGFSMAGRDEARVSAGTDLSKWYKFKHMATIVGMEEVEMERDFISLLVRGVHKQWGYKLHLEYKDIDGNIIVTKHTFYDESEQDEEFLARYIKDDKLYVWLNANNGVYVPGEVLSNTKVQSINGADKVFIYSALSTLCVGIITTLFLLLIAPFWVVVHLPILVVASVVPQIYMYLHTVNSNVKKREYTAVSALMQYGLYIDREETGVRKVKLVEQTLPMVLLEEGVGYLGYNPDKVRVLVDYDGNIPVHIASEYHIPKVVETLIEKYK